MGRRMLAAFPGAPRFHTGGQAACAGCFFPGVTDRGSRL